MAAVRWQVFGRFQPRVLHCCVTGCQLLTPCCAPQQAQHTSEQAAVERKAGSQQRVSVHGMPCPEAACAGQLLRFQSSGRCGSASLGARSSGAPSGFSAASHTLTETFYSCCDVINHMRRLKVFRSTFKQQAPAVN